MKKCPFCAEEIKDDAIKCKHCQSDLPKSSPIHTSKSSGDINIFTKSVSTKDSKKLLKVIGLVLLIIFGIIYWYIIIPLVVIWYLWKKSKFNAITKTIATFVVVAIFISIWAAMLYSNRTAKITIINPPNNAEIQSKSVIIKGRVDPKGSIVTVNGAPVSVNRGNFVYELQLAEEKTTATVQATNKTSKADSITLNITRIFTAEELAEQQAELEAQKKAQAEAGAKKQAELEAQMKSQAEAEARVKAEQAAFDKTKAGQLCQQHSSWTKQECQNVADRRYWIGMTYEMLVASYGSKPDSANPSNYGMGVQWQWCWYDYKPSCFYADEDKIIDSYN